MFCKVAGVTFDNEIEDGGRNRQSILKDLYECGRHVLTVDLVRSTYNGNPSIKVIDHLTREMLGYIPKEMISNVTDNQMTGFIMFYNECYYVQLDIQKKPSKKQYKYMQYLCSKARTIMPAYDERAYAEFFAKKGFDMDTIE